MWMFVLIGVLFVVGVTILLVNDGSYHLSQVGGGGALFLILVVLILFCMSLMKKKKMTRELPICIQNANVLQYFITQSIAKPFCYLYKHKNWQDTFRRFQQGDRHFDLLLHRRSLHLTPLVQPGTRLHLDVYLLDEQWHERWIRNCCRKQAGEMIVLTSKIHSSLNYSSIKILLII